jgi:hypothetical protein
MMNRRMILHSRHSYMQKPDLVDPAFVVMYEVGAYAATSESLRCLLWCFSTWLANTGKAK